VKAPLELEAYGRAAGAPGRKDILEAVRASVQLCNRLRAEKRIQYYEVRTTVFRGLADRPQELGKIAAGLACDAYVLQQGRPEIAMDPSFQRLEAVPRSELLALAKSVRSRPGADKIKAVKVRTREMGDETVL